MPATTTTPGLRRTAPCIGLQLRNTSPRTQPPFPPPSSPPAAAAAYDPHIMHRPIPPTLFTAVVQYDAPPQALSAHFRLPLQQVLAHWLLSNSPLTLPSAAPAVNRTSAPTAPASDFPVHHLATRLAAHLASLNNPVPAAAAAAAPAPRPSRARIDKLLHPHSARSDSSSSSAPPSSPPRRADAEDSLPSPRIARPKCGFSALATHPHLRLHPSRKSLSKSVKSLYRVARAAAPLPSHGYAEFLVEHAGHPAASFALGVVTAAHPLNALPGTRHASTALHASGRLVVEQGNWPAVAGPLRQGDVVSIATRPGAAKNVVNVLFFVNGEQKADVPVDTHRAPLHAAACLYSTDVHIAIACCPQQWRFYTHALASTHVLHPTCVDPEDVEADMSAATSASAASSLADCGCEGKATVNVHNPHAERGKSPRCASRLTPEQVQV